MAERDTFRLLQHCCDMLADDLDGQPLDIPRPGREDMVLVAAETYSRLLDRIATLEAELMTEEDREAQEEEVLQLIGKAASSGRLH